MAVCLLLAGCLLPQVELHSGVCGEPAAPALRPRQVHLLAARAAEHREPWSCNLEHQRAARPAGAARARRGAGSIGPTPVCVCEWEGGRLCAAQEGCRKLGGGRLAAAARQSSGKRPRATTDPETNRADAQLEGCETRSSSARGGGEETRGHLGHGEGVEAEAIHWPREEVQSMALVQESDVEALLEHLASTYFEKHGEIATEADLKVWGECLRSMRVDCTEVTHPSS